MIQVIKLGLNVVDRCHLGHGQKVCSTWSRSREVAMRGALDDEIDTR
jgi:hypothetical protein